ncbi:MAG: SagB/ThcOx family dehydrogenase [Planctomycetota bacterium]
MPDHRSAAEVYHQLTKYTRQNIRGGGELDWSIQPATHKKIVSQQRIPLRPHHGPFATGESADGTAFGLAHLARLLLHTGGVTGMLQTPGGSQGLRAAPSAGALYPVETYVAVREIPELDPGLYNFQVEPHQLVPMWPGDQMEDLAQACFEIPAFQKARACVLFTGIFWRSAWRYKERGYRRVLLDAGHLIGNLCSYAPLESCSAMPVLGFVDEAVNNLFFLDATVEPVLACLPILEEVTECVPEPLFRSATTLVEANLEPSEIRTHDDVPGSASVALHNAGCCLWDAAATTSDDAVPDDAGETKLPFDGDIDVRLSHAILRRRSARQYTGETIALRQLGNVLGYTFGRGDDLGSGRPVRFATREAGLMRAFLVAHGVDDLEPGVHEILGEGETLRTITAGQFSEEVCEMALGQDIARACAAVLVLIAPAAEAVERYGDRAYRYLHLEAGHIGQRWQIAAQAAELGACGIGGFLDDDVARFCGYPTDDWVLYLITLGRSQSASRP